MWEESWFRDEDQEKDQYSLYKDYEEDPNKYQYAYKDYGEDPNKDQERISILTRIMRKIPTRILTRTKEKISKVTMTILLQFFLFDTGDQV